MSALPRDRGKGVVFLANMTVKLILAGWIGERELLVRVEGGWR